MPRAVLPATGHNSRISKQEGGLHMGAAFETVYIPGDTGAEAAYGKAVDEALHEHGHDSYNGSISTTRGVRALRVEPLPKKVAQRLASTFTNAPGVEKWGDAGAILVGTEDSFTRTKHVKNINTSRNHGWEVVADVIDSLEATCGPAEWVEDVRIIDEKPRWKIIQSRTNGRVKTLYEVRRGKNTLGRFEKRAEAVKTAKDMAASWLKSGEEQGLSSYASVPAAFTVHAVCLNDAENDCVAAFAPALQDRKVRVEITMARAKPRVARAGWLFCYWAAI